MRNLLDEEFRGAVPESRRISRDEIFISTKSGYVPDDADFGKPHTTLIEELIEEGKITKEDVAGGIHCIHPEFLEH